jgi:hypothetical protein
MTTTEQDYKLAHQEINELDPDAVARLAGEERAVLLVRPNNETEKL